MATGCMENSASLGEEIHRIPETWSTLKTDSVLTDVLSQEILDGTSEGVSGLLWKTL